MNITCIPAVCYSSAKRSYVWASLCFLTIRHFIYFFKSVSYNHRPQQEKLRCFCSPLGNVAYNKSTTQTEDWGPDYTSDRAVDGITNCSSYAKTYHYRKRVWWRVNLGELFRIYSVTFYSTCEWTVLHRFVFRDARAPVFQQNKHILYTYYY